MGKLTNISTDTLIDMLYIILAGELAAVRQVVKRAIVPSLLAYARKLRITPVDALGS
jgi:hypothetical protein